MTTRKVRRYWVTQYGKIWSLSPESLHKLLKLGAEGKGYDLDKLGKALRSVPTRSYPYVRPLDWTTETFKENLRDFEANEFIFG